MRPEDVRHARYELTLAGVQWDLLTRFDKLQIREGGKPIPKDDRAALHHALLEATLVHVRSIAQDGLAMKAPQGGRSRDIMFDANPTLTDDESNQIRELVRDINHTLSHLAAARVERVQNEEWDQRLRAFGKVLHRLGKALEDLPSDHPERELIGLVQAGAALFSRPPGSVRFDPRS